MPAGSRRSKGPGFQPAPSGARLQRVPPDSGICNAGQNQATLQKSYELFSNLRNCFDLLREKYIVNKNVHKKCK
jgi:hypothetical protein